MDWKDFTDPEAVEVLSITPSKHRKLSPYRTKDGGVVAPEKSLAAAERNRIVNATDNPVKTTHCLRSKRGIRGTRCLQIKCFNYDICGFKPDSSIPKQDQICPIPEATFEARMEFYTNLGYVGENYEASKESAAICYAKLVWLEEIFIPSAGGIAAIMLAPENSTLGIVRKQQQVLDRNLRDSERIFGQTPESNFKMKLDAISFESIKDKIIKERQLGVTGGAEPRKSLAAERPAWLPPEEDEKVVDVEAVEIKANNEPYAGNPFKGKASEQYEKLKNDG